MKARYTTIAVALLGAVALSGCKFNEPKVEPRRPSIGAAKDNTKAASVGVQKASDLSTATSVGLKTILQDLNEIEKRSKNIDKLTEDLK